MRSFFWFMLATTTILAAASALASADRLEVTNIVLSDQFNVEHELVFPHDKSVILVIADRKGSDQVEPWVRALYEKYEDAVDIEGVALVTGVPKLLRGVVRKIFEEALDEKPVLLDWDGNVCDRFDYEGGKVEVHVIDSTGLRLHSVRGGYTTEAFDTVCAAVDETIEKASIGD